MARTKTMKRQTVANQNGASLPPVKQFIRGIAAESNRAAGLFSADEVDAELARYYEQGYRIASAHINMVDSPAAGGGAPSVAHWRAFYILVLADPVLADPVITDPVIAE